MDTAVDDDHLIRRNIVFLSDISKHQVGIAAHPCHHGVLETFIEDPEVIKKILKHLDLWNLKARPPPRADAPPNNIKPHLDYSDSQLPPSYGCLYVDESR